MMKGRTFKFFMAVATIVAIIVTQPFSVFAATGITATKEQADAIIDNTSEVVARFAAMGLDDRDVEELFSLMPKESSFYEKESELYLPTSEQSLESVDASDFEISDDIRETRIKSIYQTARQYFESNYYDSSAAGQQDFGTYFTYLYLSYFVDTPLLHTSDADLSYAILEDDIEAYDKFIKDTQLSEWSRRMQLLGNELYADIDCNETLATVIELNNILDDGAERMNKVAAKHSADYDTATVVKTVAPRVKGYIIRHYNRATSEKELITETAAYVEKRLGFSNFYDTYDKETTAAITDILSESIIACIRSGIPLIKYYVSAQTIFAYEEGTILSPALIGLRFSYSGRYATKTACGYVK